MTTLQQYLRRCDLNIGGLLIQETLRVVFAIRLGGDASQQPSTIRVYNLGHRHGQHHHREGYGRAPPGGLSGYAAGPAV